MAVCPQTVAEYCAANACPADLKTAEACGDSSQVTVGTCPGYIDVITNRYGYADGGAINFLFDPSSGALVGVMSPRGCSDCGNPILSCLAGPGQLWFWPSSCTDTVGCIQQ